MLSYLGELGLKDADKDKCLRYLDGHLPEDLIQVKNGVDLAPGTAGCNHMKTALKRRNIGLFLAEEQQVLRGTYEAYFETHDAITLLGSASDVYGESLIKAAEAAKPDVVLLGVKALRPAMLESLRELKEDYGRNRPSTPCVLLRRPGFKVVAVVTHRRPLGNGLSLQAHHGHS